MNQEEELFTSSDGFRISATVHNPSGKATGAIVLAHGLAGNRNSVGQYKNGFLVNLSERLASNGFRVLRFDFRGHGESEGEETDVTLSGEFADLSRAVGHILKLGSGRVGIVAISFAGGIAVQYVFQNQGKVAALVLISPELDYQRGLLETKPFWINGALTDEAGLELRQKGYLPHGNFRMGRTLINEAQMLAPCSLMPIIKCPVLTIHGDRDSIIPYEMSKQYFKCNENCELLTLDGADHGPSTLWKPDHNEKTFKATVEWFDKFL